MPTENSITRKLFTNHLGEYVTTDLNNDIPLYVTYDSHFSIADRELSNKYDILEVISNGPATIILWKDGSKTVVKRQKDDNCDLEKAIALCFAKKALGNKGNYYNHIRKAMNKVEHKDKDR